MYERWSKDRDHFLRRGRQCARYTIPSLCPPEGFNNTTDLPTPWQGIGERGVRNLASKLLLTILPPGSPFIKLMLSSAIRAEAKAAGSEGDFAKAFGDVENLVSDDLAGTSASVSMFDLLKQLLVVGNGLKHYQPDGGFLVYRLPEYVVRRDSAGKTRMVILHRKVSREDIAPEILVAVGEQSVMGPAEPIDDRTVDVYTVIRRDDVARQWFIHQEINDRVVPGSQGSDPLEFPTWVAVRMIATGGEHYGRSYVEEVLGDLSSYDGLSRHIIEGAAAMAKILFMRRPGAATRANDLKLPNLSVITGNKDDVAVLSLDKFGDFRVAMELSRDIKSRLELSFLLNSSVQRDAERVTAEEIRLMATELDDGLGGLYSTLAQEVQRPLAKFQLFRLRKAGRLPAALMDSSKVRMTLVTGLTALGRGHDLSKLRGALNDIAGMAQLNEAVPELDRAEAAKRVFAAWGVETQDLLRDPEVVTSEKQQAQLVDKLLPLIIEALKSGAATQLVKAGVAPPTQ